MKRLVTLALAVGLSAFALAGVEASAAPSKIGIGVAPSPNGYVMAGVPSQIAVKGAPSATIYLWNANERKYFRLGTATASKALPVTFQNNGTQKISVRPSKGSAKTFLIPVYRRYSAGSETPTNYGGVVLPSRSSARNGESFTANAADGCVLVDVGISVDDAKMSTAVTVLSSGGNPATLQAGYGSPAVQQNIPVKGDVIIQAKSTPDGYYVGGTANESLGIVWTCL